MKGWLLVLAPVVGMALGAQDKPAPKIVGVCAAPEGIVVCWDAKGRRDDKFIKAVEAALKKGRFSSPGNYEWGATGAGGYMPPRDYNRYVIVSHEPTDRLVYPWNSFQFDSKTLVVECRQSVGQQTAELTMYRDLPAQVTELPYKHGAEAATFKLQGSYEVPNTKMSHFFVLRPLPKFGDPARPRPELQVVRKDGRIALCEEVTQWHDGPSIYRAYVPLSEVASLRVVQRKIQPFTLGSYPPRPITAPEPVDPRTLPMGQG